MLEVTRQESRFAKTNSPDGSRRPNVHGDVHVGFGGRGNGFAAAPGLEPFQFVKC